MRCGCPSRGARSPCSSGACAAPWTTRPGSAGAFWAWAAAREARRALRDRGPGGGHRAGARASPAAALDPRPGPGAGPAPGRPGPAARGHRGREPAPGLPAVGRAAPAAHGPSGLRALRPDPARHPLDGRAAAGTPALSHRGGRPRERGRRARGRARRGVRDRPFRELGVLRRRLRLVGRARRRGRASARQPRARGAADPGADGGDRGMGARAARAMAVDAPALEDPAASGGGGAGGRDGRPFGVSTAAPRAPERILVRAPNWIGDVVLSLAAVRDLRRNFPRARIEVLARPWVADLYRAVAEVDAVRLAQGVRVDADAVRGAFDAGVLLPNSFGSALSLC